MRTLVLLLAVAALGTGCGKKMPDNIPDRPDVKLPAILSVQR